MNPELLTTRGMVALYLPQDVAEQVALRPSELYEVVPPSEMHITLCYFPEIKPEHRDHLIQQVAQTIGWHAASSTYFNGIAKFTPGDEGVPHVLLMDDREIQCLYDCLRSCYDPMPSSTHGFTPHVTLAYASDGVDVPIPFPPNVKITFNRASLVIGEQRYDFDLQGGLLVEPVYSTYAYRERMHRAGGKVDILTHGLHPVASPQPDASQQGDEDMAQTALDIAANTEKALAERLVSSGNLEEEKEGKRLAGGWRDRLSSIGEEIKKLLSWASYEDDEDDAMKALELTAEDGVGRFVVVKDASGAWRWLSFSSNAFRDREDEIVSTKAIESTVAYGDKTDDRGPLRLWHVDEADIGDCDFQAVQGRFLIESGTFRDTELAVRARKYLSESKEPIGVSIGFAYPESEFEDGIYKEIQILERSALPLEVAANPWTALIPLEGIVNDTKKNWLERVVGNDLAAQVITNAEQATKGLEMTVAYKAKDDSDEETKVTNSVGAMKALVDATGDSRLSALFGDMVAALNRKESDAPANEAPVPPPAPAPDPAPTGDGGGGEPATPGDGGDDGEGAKSLELVNALKEAFAPVFEKITDRLDALETTKETEGSNAPRGTRAFRASASKDNEIPEGEAKQKGAADGAEPDHPIAPYLADLINSNKGGNS